MSLGNEENGQVIKEVENNAGKSGAPASIMEKSVTPFDPSLEPLLKENPRRFVIFPIQYHDIWQMYKKVCIYSFICISVLRRKNHIWAAKQLRAGDPR